MPELAEVEYYRRQWDVGFHERITRVHLHGAKRVFRGADIALAQRLRGGRLESSEAAGKQMLFRFSGNLSMGIHLGMSGSLRVEKSRYDPQKHDHLVLFQKERALVFTDPRQFGRVLIHHGADTPAWWSEIGAAVTGPKFSVAVMSDFLERHGRLPIKASLLLQKGFPGIGNWMADEILWRAKIAPKRLSSSLAASEKQSLWREVRFVARQAMAKIGKDFGDPPRGWLFHERWKNGGICPKHKTALKRQTVGGRTTAWCPRCQSSHR